jgi:hypothetical protein
MSLPNATEQTLDAIVAKHGGQWSAEYRHRFAELVADVKNHQPGNPWETKQKTPEESAP